MPTVSNFTKVQHVREEEDDDDNNDVFIDDSNENGENNNLCRPITTRTSKCEQNLPPKKRFLKRMKHLKLLKCYKELKRGYTGRDEQSVYREKVGNRLKNIYNCRKRLIVMNKIDNLLFSAEIEEEDESGRDAPAMVQSYLLSASTSSTTNCV